MAIVFVIVINYNPSSMPTLFGEWFREERKKQGLTAGAIADLCGTSRSYITLIENGKRLPGKKIIPKIAFALQIETTTVINWYLQDVSQKIQEGIEVL
jgi:transcriptional regulator with XRE-family HTH domain